MAVAVLPLARPRRRLRHRRLRRHQSRFRDDEGFPPLHPGSQEARPAGHHRARHQPHVGPAPLVPARPPLDPTSERPQLVRLERHRPEIPGTRIIFTDTEKSNWTWDPRPASTTGIASSRTSPTSISTIRACERADAGDEALARHRRRRLPPRRHSLPLRARRHQQREPARDACRHQEDCAASSTITPRARCCWPKPINGRRTCRIFRPRRRMPHGLPLPADAAHLHGDRARKTAFPSPTSCARRPTSRATASGRCSCATTTS